MGRVNHFEIHAQDPERAARFYSAVFGWKFTKWDGQQEYWLIETGPDSEPGINGGMRRRTKPSACDAPIAAYVCSITVGSVDEQLAQVKSAGGSVLSPKTAIPGFGWYAACKDTEGNHFEMFQAAGQDP
jgi:uncharacterized protein